MRRDHTETGSAIGDPYNTCARASHAVRCDSARILVRSSGRPIQAKAKVSPLMPFSEMACNFLCHHVGSKGRQVQRRGCQKPVTLLNLTLKKPWESCQIQPDRYRPVWPHTQQCGMALSSRFCIIHRALRHCIVLRLHPHGSAQYAALRHGSVVRVLPKRGNATRFCHQGSA